MFTFVEAIDNRLPNLVEDIEKSIRSKQGNTLVSIQIYCEYLLKIVCVKEGFYGLERETLGSLLHDYDLFALLKSKGFILSRLKEINQLSNKIKHEGGSDFNTFEVDQSLKNIYELSITIYTTYCRKDYRVPYDQDYVSKLMQEGAIDLGKVNYLINTNNDKEGLEKQLNRLNTELNVLQRQNRELAFNNNRNEEVKKELESKNRKLNDLEAKLSKIEKNAQNDNQTVIKQMQHEIDSVRHEKNTLEKQLESYEELKKGIEKKERELIIQNVELVKNTKKIEALESKIRLLQNDNSENKRSEIEQLKREKSELMDTLTDIRLKKDKETSESVYFSKKMIEEKNIEIHKLRRQLEAVNQPATSKYQSSQTLARIPNGFTSSYVVGDAPFMITGISKVVTATSKYKSMYAVLHNVLQRGDFVSQSKYLQEKQLDDYNLKRIYRIQMTVLSLLKNDKLNDVEWQINLLHGKTNLINLAIEDIFYWVELIAALTKKPYVRPLLDIKATNDYEPTFINIGYDRDTLQNPKVYHIYDYNSLDYETTRFQMWIDESIHYRVDESNKEQLVQIMEELFGFSSFNSGQFEILQHALKGKNTIGILPTSGGKSLIYQLSSLLQPKMTLVIDPINGLVKDQIDGLRKKFNITRTLNLTSDNNQLALHKELFREGNAMFVFASPERLQNGEIRQILYSLATNKTIETIVLDEVHCLSEWGHDFRIPYLMLAETLTKYCGSHVRYLGLTATAAASVIKDLIIELGMQEEDVIYLKKLRRDNLTFSFKQFPNVVMLHQALEQQVKQVNPVLKGEDTNAMIVFSRTKRGKSHTSIEKAMQLLKPSFEAVIGEYHGDSKRSQDAFINNETSVLVATKAFGMGIDKPNIRTTVHFGIPSSFESFYQEAGRAGRDKKQADCYLYTFEVPSEQKQLVDQFFDLRTEVDQLKLIQNRCGEQVDLSTNFYFLTKDLESPEDEMKKTILVFKEINRMVKEERFELVDSNWQSERYLYILFKLGVVLNWEKNYSSHSYTLLISEHYRNIDYLKQCAIRYVSQYSEATDVISKIQALTELAQTPELVLLVRKWYYDKFVQGRRNQLANMYDKVQKYANRNCSQLIQDEIDGYFDITNIINTTKQGYSLYFEEESISNVVSYVAALDSTLLLNRKLEMERILESNTTNNISIYTALVLLRSKMFDHRNGKDRFEMTYGQMKAQEQTELFQAIALQFYSELQESEKQILIDMLYHLDKEKFKNIFLNNVKQDHIVKTYWIPFINESLNTLIRG